jgi:hypothetical protein
MTTKIAYSGLKANCELPSNISHYDGLQAVSSSLKLPETIFNFPLIDLHFSAKNLENMDAITVLDPILVMYTSENRKWVEADRTEFISNDLNPTWVKKFTVMYVFEYQQPLLFRVYDVDDPEEELGKQDFIGEAQIDLSEIVTKTDVTKLTLKFPKSKKSKGELYITSEKVEKSTANVQIIIRAIELKKENVLKKKDPFFIVAKMTETGNYLPVYQSEVAKNSKSYKGFEISKAYLCNSDPLHPLRITFFDKTKTSHFHVIGWADTNFSTLSETIGQPINLINKKEGKSGAFVVEKFNVEKLFTFVDYLKSGVQLNLITAIDFTDSNRNPKGNCE